VSEVQAVDGERVEGFGSGYGGKWSKRGMNVEPGRVSENIVFAGSDVIGDAGEVMIGVGEGVSAVVGSGAADGANVLDFGDFIAGIRVSCAIAVEVANENLVLLQQKFMRRRSTPPSEYGYWQDDLLHIKP
jgi:hypothetical protein